VLLIVRPGTEGFNGYSVFALISVLCVTLRDLATRKISGAVPSLTVTFLSASGVMASFGLASLAQEWVLPTGSQISLLLASTFFVVCGYTGSVMVMRVGEISYVAPFRYTGLVWALVLGFVVFGDWPMPLTLIGAGIVVGSGIYMLYREAQVKRAARVLLKTRGKGV
jgi:S-adenosylmethionine uptake transporter